MKCGSLYLSAPKMLVWREEDLPAVGPNEVLVESTAGAVSLGSELPEYLGTARGSEGGYPQMTGYENIAVVRECGSEVTQVSPGDRVVASYGYRTHAVLHEDRLIHVPDEISDALALLSILSCDVAKGVRKLRPMPEERTLVTGAGAIGLLAVFVLRAYGVREVDVVEPEPARCELALKFEAKEVVSPQEADDLPGSYPVCLECSARQAAFGIAQRKAAYRGRLCVLSDGNVETLALTPEFHEKELSVVGSSDGWDYRRHADWFFELVAEGKADHLTELFGLEVPVEELPATFEQISRSQKRPVKVLVRY